MKGFVAAVAAVFAAGSACASGSLPFDTGMDDGGDPSEGGSEAHDSGVSTDRGDVAEGGEDATGSSVDSSSDDTGMGARMDGGTEAAADAGPSDAGVDAETGVSPAVGSCDRSQWVVSASISALNNPPAFAVDGLLPTRWSTGAGEAVGQYFQIDFRGVVVIDQITLNDDFGSTEAADYPSGVEVLGSADGINFTTTLATASYPTNPGAIVTINFPAASVRAVQLQLTTGVPQQVWAIHELQVSCQLPDGGSGEVPSDGGADAACASTYGTWTASGGISSASWVGSASSTNSTDSDSIQGAFDDNADTRWSSGIPQGGGEWFQVDLGSATTIGAVALYLLDGNVTDYPTAYALQLSTDNLTFTTVATGLGATTTAICIPPQSARYVKITQTGTGSLEWWSIYEMSIFP